jgi:hypothetical protein
MRSNILKDVLNREPGYSQAHYYMAMSLGQLGRPKEALDHLGRPKLNAALLATDEAWLQALQGNRKPVVDLLAQRRELVMQGAAEPVSVVLCAIDAGDHDLAVWALEQMLKRRSIELFQLPRFDPVRDDPRFVTISRQIFLQ